MAKHDRATQGLRRSPVLFCWSGHGRKEGSRLRGQQVLRAGRVGARGGPIAEHTRAGAACTPCLASTTPSHDPPMRAAFQKRPRKLRVCGQVGGKGTVCESAGTRTGRARHSQRRSLPATYPVRSLSMPGARMRTNVHVHMVSRTTDRKELKSKRADMAGGASPLVFSTRTRCLRVRGVRGPQASQPCAMR